MAESTLSLSLVELQKIVGRRLGYTRDPSNWTTENEEDIAEVIVTGLRQFYWPATREPHSWTFLKPVLSVSLESGTSEYDLPDDWACLVGDYFVIDDETSMPKVMIASEQDIRLLSQSSVGNRMPEKAAVRPKAMESGDQTGQRFELVVWPTPDSDYTLLGRYEVIPFALSSSRIYPYGGAVHAETIKNSCLAAAEMFAEKVRGAEHERFMDSLMASINQDKKLSPRNIGMMGNSGRDIVADSLAVDRGNYYVLVNGIMPE